MLCKEGNSLFSALNLHLKLMDICPFADEISSSHLHCLIFLLVFIVLDDLSELLEIYGLLSLVILHLLLKKLRSAILALIKDLNLFAFLNFKKS